MRVFVFVNKVQEIGSRQTTALLVAALQRLGHEVWLADVFGVSLDASQDSVQLRISGHLLSATRDADSVEVSKFAKLQCHQAVELDVGDNDMILIRTNPGRDPDNSASHNLFLEACQVAKSLGIRVTNDPANLAFLASKAAITLLPRKYCPRMLVSNCIEEAVGFAKQLNGACVIKPLHGSRGNDVIRIESDSESFEVGLASRYENRAVVVQEFIDSEERGDKRVVVLDGKLIDHNGFLAGISRIPADGDFRANLHAGGKPMPLNLDEAQREAALAAAEILSGHGIRLAGVDLIGNKVIEFNVFSTGGLFDANRFANHDFAQVIAESLVS